MWSAFMSVFLFAIHIKAGAHTKQKKAGKVKGDYAWECAEYTVLTLNNTKHFGFKTSTASDLSLEHAPGQNVCAL